MDEYWVMKKKGGVVHMAISHTDGGFLTRCGISFRTELYFAGGDTNPFEETCKFLCRKCFRE